MEDKVKRDSKKLAFNLLDKSPEAAKMLVSLHDKQKLYALSKTHQPDARNELADIMADILSVDFNIMEVEFVTDVLLNLINKAEKDLKSAIAERIATHEKLPLRMALNFANDEIDIANPILRFSQVLNDTDLIYIIKSQTPKHWKAIAQREIISPIIIDILADTNDLDTAIMLAQNKSIVLTDYSMMIFSEKSGESKELANSLIDRSELTEVLASKIYKLVGEELKLKIKNKYPLSDVKKVEDVIDSIVFEFVEKEEVKQEPTGDMIVAAEMMLAKGTLTPHIMVQNLKRGQTQNFIAMFSVYCGLPPETILKMITQRSGQGLAVACKALKIMKSDFITIYLLTSRLRGEEFIKHTELKLSLTYYDKIDHRDAQKILNESRH